MNESLRQRARRVKSRAAVRAWEYRQRNLAKGMWFRLRRVLADAREAYIIPEHVARRLVDAGHRTEPVGDELQPPKTIVFVPEATVAQLAGARRVPVRLGNELLAARGIALVRFSPADAR